MRFRFHLHRRIGALDLVVASVESYETARALGNACLKTAKADEVYEITHGGSLVWGPYVKGGRFAP